MGGSDLFQAATLGNAWERISCPGCGSDFSVAEAVDEMFVDGNDWAYVYFVGCKKIVRHVRCAPGRSAIVDIRGILDRVFRVVPMHAGMSGVLAGGVSWKHIPQGFVMVATASPDDWQAEPPTDFFLSIIGRSADAPAIPVWRELLLRARLAAFEHPDLTPVLAVAAIDIFIEGATGKETRPPRPESWRDMLSEASVPIDAYSNAQLWEHLKILNRVRNKLAHEKDYISELPEYLAKAEIEWLKRDRVVEGESAITPVAKFSIRTVLAMIRVCRQAIAASH